jgi:hypothetical protein
MFFLCYGPCISAWIEPGSPYARRSPWVAPAKQPDGSAKTGEVKLCIIWSAESLDEEGTPIRDEGSVTYSAALESACALDTTAARSHFAADDQFPDATQIVDRFYAKRHLSNLGKALYGPNAPRAAQWAERRKEEFDTGKFSALLTAIRRQVYRSEDARRCLHYFQTNRERMRYPEFHAQGLCTSTGVVEAARSPSAHGSNVPECTGPSPL